MLVSYSCAGCVRRINYYRILPAEILHSRNRQEFELYPATGEANASAVEAARFSGASPLGVAVVPQMLVQCCDEAA